MQKDYPYVKKVTKLQILIVLSKIEKVLRGLQGEKSSRDTASLRNLVSTIGAQASPEKGEGTRAGIHKDS